MSETSPPAPPMDLANMRNNGVRSLKVTCLKCTAQRVVNVDDQPGHLTVKSFERRMVCQQCEAKRADVRPNWIES